MSLPFLLGIILVIGLGLVGFVLLGQVAGIDIKSIIGLKLPFDLGTSDQDKTNGGTSGTTGVVIGTLGVPLTPSEVSYKISETILNFINNNFNKNGDKKFCEGGTSTCNKDWNYVGGFSFKLESSWDALSKDPGGELEKLQKNYNYKVQRCGIFVDEPCLTAQLNATGMCSGPIKNTIKGLLIGNEICVGNQEKKSPWSDGYCKKTCFAVPEGSGSSADQSNIICHWRTEKDWGEYSDTNDPSQVGGWNYGYAAFVYWDDVQEDWWGKGDDNCFRVYFFKMPIEQEFTINSKSEIDNVAAAMCNAWTKSRVYDETFGGYNPGTSNADLRAVWKANVTINAEDIKFTDIENAIKNKCKNAYGGKASDLITTALGTGSFAGQRQYSSKKASTAESCLTSLEYTEAYIGSDALHFVTNLNINPPLLTYDIPKGKYKFVLNSWRDKHICDSVQVKNKFCDDISIRICKEETTSSTSSGTLPTTTYTCTQKSDQTCESTCPTSKEINSTGTCQSGVCCKSKTTTAEECTSENQQRCSGNKVQTCTKTDSKLTWYTVLECATGKTCKETGTPVTAACS